MEERAFDLKSKEEKQDFISSLGGEMLLSAFDGYCAHFDPLSEKFFETYSILRDEIIRRCDGYMEIKGLLRKALEV